MRVLRFAHDARAVRLFSKAIFLCALIIFSLPAHAQQEQAPLTNSAIIKLVHAGFKDKTVIAIIRTKISHFDLAPDRLIELKKSGVSENVILAMIAHQDASDPFFDDSLDSMQRSDLKQSPKEGSSDIFGAGNESNGSTRGRGRSSANQDNSLTTGSATVRIVRPPREEGGAPKLEKTPTLSNDSIVAMVEAGFSEGTIIRRIEQSPAEFDLGATKLRELRKRRVTEPVISAMRAAMGDDATSVRPTTPPALKNPDN